MFRRTEVDEMKLDKYFRGYATIDLDKIFRNVMNMKEKNILY